MRRVVILGTSGAGKTTLARALAEIHDLPHIDLDALTSGTYPPITGEAFVTRVREIVARSGWVIDGDYQRGLGELVLSRAEVTVWLDLPLRVSLARMWRRTSSDIRAGARTVHIGLLRWVAHEVSSHVRRRFVMPKRLSAHPGLHVVHLRNQEQVDRWLEAQTSRRPRVTFPHTGARARRLS